MFGSDVLVAEPFRFFGGVIEDALAFLAERHFDRRGNAFANGDARFNLLADGFDRAVRPQKTVRERLVFAQQSEQQVLRLDVRAAILAGLVPREKDYSPSLFCIAFKHGSPTLLGVFAPALAARSVSAPCLRALLARRQLPVFQIQNAICAPRQGQIVCRENRRQMMRLVQTLHQLENRSPHSVRPDRRSVRPPAAITARFTSARAIATRCCSPPESSAARCAARSAKTNFRQPFSRRAQRFAATCPRISRGIATFSAAVKSGSRWCRCHTNPTDLLRYSASSRLSKRTE